MMYQRQNQKSRQTVRRHKLTVQRPTRANQIGYTVPTMQPIGPFWGSLDPVSERQRVMYQTISAEVTHVVKVDARADIQEKDQIVFKGRTFEVLTAVNINEVERDKLITTKEIRPAANG